MREAAQKDTGKQACFEYKENTYTQMGLTTGGISTVACAGGVSKTAKITRKIRRGVSCRNYEHIV